MPITTTDPKVLHNRALAIQNGQYGAQGDLIIISAPAGATAMVGKPLVEQSLTVDGAYVCLIPIAGLKTVKTHVKPQLTSSTGTTAGPDELAPIDPRTEDVSAAQVITAGTGDGAVSDDTLQTASLTTTGGFYALFTYTAADAPGTTTFDVASYEGIS